MWTHPEAHPGEFLRLRFLEPLGLSAADLARGCRMPRSRVSEILAGKRGLTADTAMRLGSFFRMEPEQWMALQADFDLAHAEPDASIVPLDPPGFLIGPLGATPLPTARPRRPALVVPPHAPADASPPLAAEPGPQRHHEEVRYPDGTRALVSRPG
ncbi:MAG: HigA family addiction module antidote protein [Alphaproteobacteria bacterium]|nr:HigA family addiction module antidote protein [Alphaproteobacteria bacterium]